MNGYGNLAYTGAGALILGGVVIDQIWLVAVASGVVLLGALIVRVSFRRGKTPLDV